MRFAGWFVFLAVGCASRSSLPGGDTSMADAAIEVAPDAWSRDVSGSTCAERTSTCPVDDFGPLKTVQAVYEECAAATGAACGDLVLVFDAEGCLARIADITYYSPAFVECVARVTGAKRWQCAIGGNSLHMFESCAR